jgi:hypothetical protein
MNTYDDPVEPTPPDEPPHDGSPAPQHPAVEPGSVLRSHSVERILAIALGVVVLAAIGAFLLARHTGQRAVSQVGVQRQAPFGRGGFGGRFPGSAMGMRGFFDPRAELPVVAQTIGISQNDLISALQSGQSIADVAKAHHVDPNKVIDAVYNSERQQVQQMVSSGRITQAQADRFESLLKGRIEARINGAMGGRGFGGPGPQQQQPPGQPSPQPSASASSTNT